MASSVTKTIIELFVISILAGTVLVVGLQALATANLTGLDVQTILLYSVISIAIIVAVVVKIFDMVV